jgi:hypothetical protein
VVGYYPRWGGLYNSREDRSPTPEPLGTPGASQIHNWDDLVRTFVGNFQGTYVRLRNSWDLRACT